MSGTANLMCLLISACSSPASERVRAEHFPDTADGSGKHPLPRPLPPPTQEPGARVLMGHSSGQAWGRVSFPFYLGEWSLLSLFCRMNPVRPT